MLRYDLQQVYNLINYKSKVLDLGCGDGSLLQELINKKQCLGYGVEIDIDNVISSMNKNINVIQGNLEHNLNIFENNSFDYIVLSQTIQTMLRVKEILIDMIRVARYVIVTFPNFGFWKNRLQVLFKGCMPKSVSMPYEWHNTSNLHLCTLKDFEGLCNDNNLLIDKKLVMNNLKQVKILPNLFGSLALYKLSKK